MNEYGTSVRLGEKYPLWRVVDFRHVPAERNSMRHLLYVTLEDAEGNRLADVDGLAVRFCWEGMRQDEVPPDAKPDKPAPEPHCNIALYPGQVTTAWIVEEGAGSDAIVGVHTSWPSDGEGNEHGHHSFEVTFRKVRKIDGFQVEPAGFETAPEMDVRAAILDLQRDVLVIFSELRSLSDRIEAAHG